MSDLHSISIITKNEKMRKIISRLDKAIQTDSSILLIGETGVGKELFAEYIHKTSPRFMEPFVKISLSALPAELLESELFGHEKGSFTSASMEKKGLFELANNGSIFLDDIDDFPIRLQSKLLRALESSEIMRIGAQATTKVNVRVIAASKIDLKELVEKELFRSDLFFRLNVVPVEIPPLRERVDDVDLLANYFLKKFSTNGSMNFSDESLQAMLNYDWPGNVRELKNVIQRISIYAGDVIELSDLPSEISNIDNLSALLKSCSKCFVKDGMTFDQAVACLESNLLIQAMKKSNSNKTKAANLLGMSLSTFRDKLKKYQLEG